MKFRIAINERLAEPERTLVAKYWAIREGEFEHKVSELARASNLSVPSVTALAAANASCQVSYGYCLGCGDELLETVTTKAKLLACLSDYSRTRCPACQLAHEKRQQFEQRLASGQVATALGPNAAELRTWEKLPAAELEVLAAIVQLKFKPLIYGQLFKDGNLADKAVWDLINKLAKKGLVVINHDYETGRIVESFSYPPALEAVFSHCNLSEGPARPVDYLGLRLHLNPDKSAKYYATYTGVVTMQQDVHLRGGHHYAFAGWVRQKDASISLQITPFERLLTEEPSGTLVEGEVIRAVLARLGPAAAD